MPDFPPTNVAPTPSRGARLFVRLLIGVTICYAMMIGYFLWLVPPPGINTVEASSSFTERCRRICEKYGLIPSGNVKRDAEEFLNAVKKEDKDLELPESSHPLILQPAPDFELLDDAEKPIRFSKFRGSGPALIVFYFGYHCPHCVAQLFGLKDDYAAFEKLGIRIIAVSSDPPSETSAKFDEFGRFPFTVVADPDDIVAKKYGCYATTADASGTLQLHGTFLVDRAGIIRWAETGEQPFTNNSALLRRAATLVP